MNKRLKEIETRLAAIKAELRNEDADIEKLNDEVDALMEERQKIVDKIEQRKRTLQKIAEGEEGEGEPVLITPPEERAYGVDSKEYRDAWLKNIRGIELSNIEKRAITTGVSSAGAAVPTTTLNKIIEKVHQYAPLLDEITLLNVKGYVTIPAEGTVADAAKHAEGATITAANDTITKITLGAYEVTKLITISKSVETMSIDAFEKWLVDRLARSIAEKLSALIINGSGTGEAQGIDKITWDESNSVTVGKDAALTEANILTVVGLLNGGYDAGSKWYMSKKTFFADFYPLMNKAKNITVAYENGHYYVQGYVVEMDDRITVHEAFLGNMYRGYAGNLAENVNVTSQFVTRENAYDFLGAAMFDGKVQAVEAFVKIIKAAS